MNEEAIGVFDSGVGGLTVVRELIRQLPNERIIYIGDSARAPYGPRPQEQVKAFSWQLTQFLQKQKIKMLVIACNTATAAALDEIKKNVDIPVVGVIVPGSRAAIKSTVTRHIGVIGTVGTIHSQAYEKAIHSKSPGIRISAFPCPKFVPVVESNEYSSPIAKKIVFEALQVFRYDKPDTLVLGCTHYPLLSPIIQSVMGPNVKLIDSGAETVSDVSLLLDYFDLSASNHQEKEIKHQFYTTGSAKMFAEIAQNWLPLEDIQVEHIAINQLEGSNEND